MRGLMRLQEMLQTFAQELLHPAGLHIRLDMEVLSPITQCFCYVRNVEVLKTIESAKSEVYKANDSVCWHAFSLNPSSTTHCQVKPLWGLKIRSKNMLKGSFTYKQKKKTNLCHIHLSHSWTLFIKLLEMPCWEDFFHEPSFELLLKSLQISNMQKKETDFQTH